MSEDLSSKDTPQIPLLGLLPFLLIAFGLAWAIIALYILLPDQMIPLFGELTGQHPLFFLAVYAPAIAAFVVVIMTLFFVAAAILVVWFNRKDMLDRASGVTEVIPLTTNNSPTRITTE